MFHNFYLKDTERDYIRFYWYRDNDSSKEVCQFRAKVHIFGNCSSPALASLGLQFAANSSSKDHVKKFVKEQFYVDDGLHCAETVSDAISILQDTRDTLSKFNIRLHKICSSSQDVVDHFPESERATRSTVTLDDNSEQSALGLIWDVSNDRIILRSDIRNHPFTRRGVLATVNSIFDPLRISSPLVLGGKILQRMLLSTDSEELTEVYWDKELSQEHRDA